MNAWEQEKLDLLAEQALVMRLPLLEDLAKSADGEPFAKDLLIMARLLKRKHNECNSHREHLEHLKDYFSQCYDSEEGDFDDSLYERDGARPYVIGHWCKNLIGDLTEALDNGNVYMPLDISEKI